MGKANGKMYMSYSRLFKIADFRAEFFYTQDSKADFLDTIVHNHIQQKEQVVVNWRLKWQLFEQNFSVYTNSKSTFLTLN